MGLSGNAEGPKREVVFDAPAIAGQAMKTGRTSECHNRRRHEKQKPVK
jgi:hypothetical protein